MNKEMMQDSGVEWIGAIPQGWKWYRIKDVAELSPTYSADKPDSEMLCTVIPMECVSEKGIVDTSNVDKYGNISKGLTFFEKGDVIFAKITPCMENGKGAYIENLPTKYAFGSTEFHVLRTGYKLNGKFLYYYTFNDGFRDYAAVNMTGAAGQKRVSTNFLKYTPIYLPDISEQQAITRYLDQRCGKLDAIIAIKRQQIKTLDALRQSIIYHAVTKGLDDSVPLVDSGVEWLGKIPAHWKTQQIKRRCELLRGKFSHRPRNDPAFYNGDYPFVQTGDVTSANKYIKTYSQTLNELGFSVSKMFPRKTLVMTIAANIGDVAILDFDACFPDSLVGLVPNHDTYLDFLYYLMLAMKGILLKSAILTTQLNLNNVQIGTIFAPFPPISEQQAIALHLDQETQFLNDLKANLSQQIRTLEAYKKALIYECVTGKKRIKADDLKTG